MSWDQKLLHWHLKTRRFGREILFFEELDSTNRWLADNHSQFKFSGGVVVAGHQTAGSGRFERKWFDQAGRSLLFSLLLRHKLPEGLSGFLSLLPAIALGEFLTKRFGSSQEITLKWPNDVQLNHRKIAGILGQTVMNSGTQLTILGMGVNVAGSRAELPMELQETASSIQGETDTLIAREILMAEILNRLEPLYDDLLDEKSSDISERWLKLAIPLGTAMRRVSAGNVISGTFAGLGERGQLLLKDDSGTVHQLFSGDIEC